MTDKRRDRLFILARILDRAKEPATKKDLVYDVRLSFTQAKNYISLLTDLKLLREANQNGDVVFKTTKKGQAFLEHYEEIVQKLEKA